MENGGRDAMLASPMLASLHKTDRAQKNRQRNTTGFNYYTIAKLIIKNTSSYILNSLIYIIYFLT